MSSESATGLANAFLLIRFPSAMCVYFGRLKYLDRGSFIHNVQDPQNEAASCNIEPPHSGEDDHSDATVHRVSHSADLPSTEEPLDNELDSLISDGTCALHGIALTLHGEAGSFDGSIAIATQFCDGTTSSGENLEESSTQFKAPCSVIDKEIPSGQPQTPTAIDNATVPFSESRIAPAAFTVAAGSVATAPRLSGICGMITGEKEADSTPSLVVGTANGVRSQKVCSGVRGEVSNDVTADSPQVCDAI